MGPYPSATHRSATFWDGGSFEVGMTTVDQVLTDTTVLDNPVWASLTAAHGHLAEIDGGAGRYLPTVAPHTALRDHGDPADWYDLRRLVGRGREFALSGDGLLPRGWEVVRVVDGVQFVGPAVRAEAAGDAVVLEADDVPEMLDLVRRTNPGPFQPRVIEMGTYLGFRRNEKLVAMAGERLRPPGWTEISAVCTDLAYRGRGLATRLVLTVAAGIRDRGDTPFLHTSASNMTAIRLYESLGFTLRRTTRFRVVRSL